MPLTVIRASAGSGKTFQLAMSFIRILLAAEIAGQPQNPSAILATTFTRAAAGEILDRVLRLVAEAMLSKERRDFLASQLGLPLSVAHCGRLLSALAAHVDRLAISTMDAFFGQISKAFSSDLGFAPDWTMAVNEAEADLLRRTLHALLNATDHRSLGAALWTFRRGVISSMLDALRELAPGFSSARQEENVAAEFAEPELHRWNSEEVAPSARALADRSAWIPRNKSDRKPSKNWETALDKIADAIRPGAEAVALIGQTLAQKILFGGDYCKHPIPPELRDALLPLAERSSSAMRARHHAREDALRWLGAHYSRHRRAANYSGGAYTFSDVAAMVTSAALDCSDLYFRLGTRYEHVLFDEFQDTSRLQFRFFQPIVEEVGSTGGQVLIVGDEKQAIYGWRGSDRALMHAPLRELSARIGDGGEKTLDQSFRSSPAVLKAVNRTFTRLLTPWLGENEKDGEVLESAGREWAAAFPEHRPAKVVEKLQGRVRVLKVPNEPDGDTESHKQALVAKALELVGGHLAEDPQRKIAVLLRKNALMPQLIASLRNAHPDVDVSGEGGNPLTDSRAVEVILGVLTWLDHPGSTAAHHLVTRSVLAPVFGFQGSADCAEEATLAIELRRRIMEHGYATVIREWIRHSAFPAACSDHDRQRCEQLLEVAREFDAQGPGRISEFVAHVRARRIERPGGSGVRVMTIHASKGLEFEAVILVDIDARPGGHGTPMLHDPDGTFHIVPSKDQAPLMGLEELVQRNLREDFMEELSVLYVAMTRARSFLDIVLRAEAKVPVAALLRAALLPVGEDGIAEEFEGVSFRASQEARGESNATPGGNDPGVAADVAEQSAPLASAFGRTVQITPSGANERRHGEHRAHPLDGKPRSDAPWRTDPRMAAADRVDGRRSCRMPRHGSHPLRKPQATWIAVTLRSGLEASSRKHRPPARDLHRTFTRPSASPGETVELWRERRFAVIRENGGRNEVISGSFDRVVLWRDTKGRAVRAEITDFKTDRFDSAKERAQVEARYAPQLEAYRKALCLLCPRTRCQRGCNLTRFRENRRRRTPCVIPLQQNHLAGK